MFVFAGHRRPTKLTTHQDIWNLASAFTTQNQLAPHFHQTRCIYRDFRNVSLLITHFYKTTDLREKTHRSPPFPEESTARATARVHPGSMLLTTYINKIIHDDMIQYAAYTRYPCPKSTIFAHQEAYMQEELIPRSTLLRLTLPLPPSINEQYATVNGHRVSSAVARNFKKTGTRYIADA